MKLSVLGEQRTVKINVFSSCSVFVVLVNKHSLSKKVEKTKYLKLIDGVFGSS